MVGKNVAASHAEGALFVSTESEGLGAKSAEGVRFASTVNERMFARNAAAVIYAYTVRERAAASHAEGAPSVSTGSREGIAGRGVEGAQFASTLSRSAAAMSAGNLHLTEEKKRRATSERAKLFASIRDREVAARTAEGALSVCTGSGRIGVGIAEERAFVSIVDRRVNARSVPLVDKASSRLFLPWRRAERAVSVCITRKRACVRSVEGAVEVAVEVAVCASMAGRRISARNASPSVT
jgi:hypothetical protein